MRIKLAILTTVLAVLLLPATALAAAPPGPPLGFTGSVTIGGVDAPVGTTVSAEIESIEVASINTSAAGQYSIQIAPEGNIGKMVVFKVNGVIGGEHLCVDSWETPIVSLNLAISGVSYTLTMAVTGNGSTTPAVGGHDYTSGTAVPITAIPDAGWLFDSWTGDVADTLSASTTVTVDADKTVTASFIEIPGALVADAGGSYNGTAGSSVSLSGSASGGTAPYTYAWDLDNDGAYDDSTAQNPSYTWASAGDYTVGLQVTDSATPANTDTDTASVHVVIASHGGVGGTAYPPNKPAILAPWIALGVAIIAGATIFARRRRAES
ncbi:MAG: PKD domain-containing protein [Dehalococcoidia bacterium]|nr:PKD domain-containing protein [Dehalococcoidia bacterium]